MAASSKLMIGEAERRFPVRTTLALPVGGFGTRLTEIHTWLDDNCRANGWAMTPSGLRGVVNERSQSTSLIRPLPLHSSRGGALGRKWSQSTAFSVCARAHRSRGFQRRRTAARQGDPASNPSLRAFRFDPRFSNHPLHCCDDLGRTHPFRQQFVPARYPLRQLQDQIAHNEGLRSKRCCRVGDF